jgi:glutathione S-transferase
MAGTLWRRERMDYELDGHKFIVSDRFTVADITAPVAIDFGGRLADIQMAPGLARLTRWHETVSKRASVKT